MPSSGDHSFAQTPNTVPSEPCSGTRNPQLWQAAAEATAPALVGPCGPRYQRSAASSRPCGREHPHAGQRELVDRDGVELGVAGRRPAGLEPRVVGTERQHVAGADVARTDPLRPRQPGLAEDRVGPGQQLGLADGRGAAARHARDGDGPLPAAVAAGGRGEPVRDQPLALDDQAEVLADVGGVLGELDRDLTGQVDRRAEDGVLRRCGHAQASMSSATARSRVAYWVPRAFSG